MISDDSKILPPKRTSEREREGGEMVKWRQINVDSDQILKRGLEAKKSISQTKLPPYSASAAAASKPKGNSVHSLLRHMTKGKDMFVAPIDKLQLNQTWKSAVFSRVSPVQDTWGHMVP